MKKNTTGTTQNPFIAKRLYSLDALRGFDMFWIVGADHLIHRLATVTDSPFIDAIGNQLTHPDWHGFHFYDLIFPLFLFLAGVSTPFSVQSRLNRGGTQKSVLRHIVKRGLILVLLGIIYNNGLEIQPLSEIRFGSVLGRIGLAYMFANIIYLYANRKSQYLWFGGLLIGYWLLLKFTSAPGFPPGDLTMEGNFASYVDRILMPGKLYKGIHDPEGLFSTIPAISTGLLGIFAGRLLKEESLSGTAKTRWLFIAGCVSLAIAFLWNLDFPFNKNLWSSSFVMLTGSISLFLLAVFYYIIDVKGFQKWAFFFRVIGMNSILIYMSGHFIDWKYTTNAFFQWAGQLTGEIYGVVMMACCYILVKWLFLYYLYKKKIFLKV